MRAETFWMRGGAAAVFGAALAAAPAAQAEPGSVIFTEDSHQARFQVRVVAEGFDFPWSIAFLPGGDMLVAERSGALKRVAPDGAAREIAHDLAVTTINQGGLHDAIPHPDFAENRLVYIAYATGGERRPATALARARLSIDGLSLENAEEIFRADMRAARGRHFGGKIVWLDDGTLALTLGDGGNYQTEAQDPSNHWGAIVRLTADGAPAEGNPDLGEGAKPDIWSYGHRNVQGADLHPETRALWTHEHGARGGDELNIAEAGGNYGWPTVSYGINYNGTPISDVQSGEGFEEPIWYWRPSIAPSGLSFYTGDEFPNWRGDLFVGALAGMQVQRLELDGERVIGAEPLLLDLEERIRDVRQGPDGRLYVTTDSPEGRILRIEPAT